MNTNRIIAGALPYLEAVLIRGRAAVVYSQNDLGGAWARLLFLLFFGNCAIPPS